MNRIIVLVAGLLTTAASAQNSTEAAAVTFSKYSSVLQLTSYDEQTHTHTFKGTITLTGTLFLVFDMESPDRANGEINFQKFVPDPESALQLPAVIAGFYPGPVRYVNLDAPLDQLVALFGGKAEFSRISHGTSHEVSTRAKVEVRDYSATVECDSRSYWAHVVSLAPLRESQQLASREAPHGC